jgi:RNA-directed DNA polymerase
VIGVGHDVPGGKGPDFDHAGGGGKRQGMTGSARSNNPGRPGSVVTGPSPALGEPRPVKVGELQRKLWTAAKQSPGRCFHALFDRVHRGEVLWEAWERVRSNRGAAGVDRMALGAVQECGGGPHVA